MSVQAASETDTVDTVTPATRPVESEPPDLDIRRLSRRALTQLDEPGGGSSGRGDGDLRDTDETVWTGYTDWLR